MSETKEEMIKHIDAAIELESKSAAMYEKFAQESDNQHSKLLFERMHEVEKKHLDYVNSLKKAVEDEEVGEDNIESLKELDPKDIMSMSDEGKEKASKSYLEALNQIVELEKRAHKFYRELEGKAPSEELKLIFKTLAEFEKSHWQLFDHELELLKNNPYN